MPTFKDSLGREWDLTIDQNAIERVRSLTGVDLRAFARKGFRGFEKILVDASRLVDVIYCVCKDQADKTGISDEEFGRGVGSGIAEAVPAFIEALLLFFKSRSVKPGLEKALGAARRKLG